MENLSEPENEVLASANAAATEKQETDEMRARLESDLQTTLLELDAARDSERKANQRAEVLEKERTALQAEKARLADDLAAAEARAARIGKFAFGASAVAIFAGVAHVARRRTQ